MSAIKFVEKWTGITKDQLASLRDHVKPHQTFIYELLLDSESLFQSREQPWDYKALSDYIAEDFSTSHIRYIVKDGEQPNLQDLLYETTKEYGNCVSRSLYQVGDGLLIYVKDGPANIFREGNKSDNNWSILTSIVENDVPISDYIPAPPAWLNGLFISKRNLRAYEAIWHDEPSTNDEEFEFCKWFRRTAVELYSRGAFDPAAIPESRQLPNELRAALDAFHVVSGDQRLVATRSPRAALVDWLEKNRPDLSVNARDRVATVANWQPSGGAPKTPSV